PAQADAHREAVFPRTDDCDTCSRAQSLRSAYRARLIAPLRLGIYRKPFIVARVVRPVSWSCLESDRATTERVYRPLPAVDPFESPDTSVLNCSASRYPARAIRFRAFAWAVDS